jgi:hypothetical protein
MTNSIYKNTNLMITYIHIAQKTFVFTTYYSRGCDSKEMFSSLKIAGGSSFEKHMNSYNVIHINIVELFRAEKSMTDNIDYMSKRLLHELRKQRYRLF